MNTQNNPDTTSDSNFRLLRVLILEENVADAKLMEEELRDAGMKIESKRVYNEAAYLRALRTFTPELILSGLDLPRFNGIKARVNLFSIESRAI
jgi:DNA-binding response OmpR family regulator